MPDNLMESVQAKVSQTGTTGTLVAAIPGSRIKITSLILGPTTAVSCSFNLQSHTTTTISTGSLLLNSSTTSDYPLILDYHPDGWFTSARGEAVDLVTSTTVGGSVTWVAD